MHGSHPAKRLLSATKQVNSEACPEHQVHCWTQPTVDHNHLKHNNKQVQPPGFCDIIMHTWQAALGGCPLAAQSHDL